MSDQPPQRPGRPKHVPFWPVLIGLAFMVAVVVSGVIASNHARSKNVGASISTSTLPSRGATSSTTTSSTVAAKSGSSTTAPPTTVTPQSVQAYAGSDACTADNLKVALVASGQVDEKTLGPVTVTKFKCASGYAIAAISNAKVGDASADFILKGQVWAMLNLGAVNPVDDGVPTAIADQLTLN